ncbi:hypothetical protein CARUB_v10020942mg [Capsella rubella]|uniref:Uncharacterized protein n=1 Tax=Capsella rubella TaxID=81985 RepID=R0GJ01_9BRAS|nr:uncharacterized protein LOC17894431 [Capsella rubella]EOA35716.1 hypothetical protein CARUB_v10020942mg [Capsella rubella]
MVSRQEGTLYSRKRDFTIYGEELLNSFKKSKQEDHSQSTLFNERPNSVTFDFELHLYNPLPSDWQAKEDSRTSEDHKTYSKDPVIVGRPKMSLDLELNLSPSGSPSRTTTKRDKSSNHNETVSPNGKSLTSSSKMSITGTGLSRSPSWLAFEGGDDDDVDHKEQEMVTTVCMKCHMLVMLCTSNPVCPNCKFMHPQDHSATKLFEPSNLLRLLC